MTSPHWREIAERVYADATGSKWDHHSKLQPDGARCGVCEHGVSTIESALADASRHGAREALERAADRASFLGAHVLAEELRKQAEAGDQTT